MRLTTTAIIFLYVRPLLVEHLQVQSVDGQGSTPDLLVVANPSHPRFAPLAVPREPVKIGDTSASLVSLTVDRSGYG
jgi:hypothetical protein